MRYEMAPNQRQQHIIGGVDPDYVTYSCVSPKEGERCGDSWGDGAGVRASGH